MSGNLLLKLIKMELREYYKEDKKDCLDIAISNVPAYLSEKDFTEFKEWFEKQDCSNLYVLIDNSKLIGIGGFYFQEGQARLIYGLIHKDYHRKGYGEYLTEYRIKKIKAINPMVPIGLETTEKTYMFFEKFGFRTVEVIPKHYHGKFDKYEMILESINLESINKE